MPRPGPRRPRLVRYVTERDEWKSRAEKAEARLAALDYQICRAQSNGEAWFRWHGWGWFTALAPDYREGWDERRDCTELET